MCVMGCDAMLFHCANINKREKNKNPIIMGNDTMHIFLTVLRQFIRGTDLNANLHFNSLFDLKFWVVNSELVGTRKYLC